MSGLGRRIALLLLMSLACATVSQAYYHFIRFAGRTAPWRALPEKFDINALPNKTLSYFISDQNSIQFAPSDTFAGMVSQIRAAAQVWNDVETSELRLAFGGFLAPGVVQTAPTLEILFDEVPPGVAAIAGPTIRAEMNGTFVPILKSVVILPPDDRRKPSYTEAFFGTLVHELGHALGLQHTLTSGVMSTATTRSVSKSKPLTPDDVAGISLLYPSRTFLSTTGSISGRVVLQGGQGVNLASVVAISTAGAAISTLTNPDGTYHIDGLPPRSYYVYVHPLPPPLPGETTFAAITYPIDQDGRSLGPGVPFDTVFFRAPNEGTSDPDLAAPLAVSAGSLVENINFNVRSRNQVSIHSVQAWAYPAGVAVKPAYLSAAIAQPNLVVSGVGLVSGTNAAAGLRARVLGGPTLTPRAFSSGPYTYLQLQFDARTLAFSTDTPRHLVFTLNNDIYVLPSAFFHVGKQPPVIGGVTPSAEGGPRLAILTGVELSAETRVLFDGIPAAFRSYDPASQRLTVAPPPGPLGHRAAVAALNPDGQSSLFVQGDAPPVYTYTPETATVVATAAFLPTPALLPAGTEAMVQIDTAGATFVDGMVSVGLGTSDVVVRRLWVVSPTRLLANVTVNPWALPGAYTLTIASGLHVASQPFAFQVLPANPRAFWLSSSVTNFTTQQPSVTAGAFATMTVGNSPMPVSPTSATVLLGEQRLPVLMVNGNQISFQIPAGTPIGPAVISLESNGERSLPIVIPIDPAPPVILSATAANQVLDAGRPARAGETINLIVSNLEGPGDQINPLRLVVNIGGVHVNVASVADAGDDAHKLTLVLPSHSPVGANIPVSVEIEDRTSQPIGVSISE